MANLINSIIKHDETKLEVAGPITNEEAIKLIKEYRNCEGWGSGKTRAIWFSAEEIRNILKEIPASMGDGIRIYFAKYPETGVDLPSPDYKHRNTLVFVPTTIEIIGGVTRHKNIVDVEALIDGVPPPNSPGGSPSNHGQLCPPNC
jgi:hypothetical protein